MDALISILLLPVFMSSPITLETKKDLFLFTQTKKLVASNGDILAMTPFELYHWDQDGRLINRYGLPQSDDKPRFLSTFHYDPRRKIVWLIYGGTEPYSFFFNELGEMVGEGYLVGPQGEGKPANYRHLLSVGSRVFALQNNSGDAWGRSREHIIQQVDFEVTNEGVAIRRHGEPFGAFSELQKEYQYDFKRHWLVQNGLTKNFSMFNQLDKSMTPYQPSENQPIEAGLIIRGKEKRLHLPNWESPPTVKLNQVKPPSNEYHLFSQITGAYLWNDRSLIVGYTIPHPQDPDVHEFGVQKIRFNGSVDGSSLRENGYFLGVHDGYVYALQPEGKKGNKIYKVKKISW